MSGKIQSYCKCSDCGAYILWKKVEGHKISYNALQWAGSWKATDLPHWQTCSANLTRNCPACRIVNSGDLDMLFRINVDKPLCPDHLKSFTIFGWNRDETYSTEDLHYLRKKIQLQKKRTTKVEDRIIGEMGFHPLDAVVYG